MIVFLLLPNPTGKHIHREVVGPPGEKMFFFKALYVELPMEEFPLSIQELLELSKFSEALSICP